MKKLLRYLLPVAILTLAAGLFTSCDDDDDYFGADFITDTFTVRSNDWIWNDLYDRYEYVFQYREIDNYIYNTGTVIGAVYITEDGFTANGSPITFTEAKPMPFVHTYFDPDLNAPYTETISFGYAPGEIAFYIQSDDLFEPFLDTYQFKINILYRTQF